MPFSNLLNAPGVLPTNLQQAISINNGSTPAQRSQAVIDNAITTDNGIVVADGLGTRLNQVYQAAITANSPLLAPNGNIVQFFRQVNGISQADSGFSKNFFANSTVDGTVPSSRINSNPNIYDQAYNVRPLRSLDTLGNSRPYQVAPSQIQNFAPQVTSALNNNPAFPSGHTTFGYTQELLFATMVPERYQQLLTRASEYGNSRIVLGAHYPLDVIGGRIIATYDVAQMLNNNPAYLNQNINVFAVGAVTTTNNFNALFQNATTDLRSLLASGCGTDIATCSASGAADRFSNSAQNRSDYLFRLTYGLPSFGRTDLPPVVPDGAEVLLATRFPYLTAAQRRDVLASTELPSGVPLDDGTGWARLNLYSAADGYASFTGNVAVTMNAALGGFNALDSWNNNISGPGGLSLGGTGTLILTGADTYTGPTTVNGGTLVVNGSIASPTTVNLGGALRGTGLINASLTNNGIVAPGNSVGTMTIGGNFVQGPSGTLLTQIDQTGASRLVVGGAASLNGTLQLQPLNNFTASFGQNFTVLSATRGVSGVFSNFLAPALPGSLFYQPIYTPQAVGVMAAQPLANFAQTANQRAVATVLDRGRLTPDVNVQNALSALYPAEIGGDVPGGLDQVTPQNVFTETVFGQRFAGILANQFAGRTSALRAGAAGFSVASSRFDMPGSGSGATASNMIESARANQLAAADGGTGWFLPPGSPIGGFVSGQLVFGDRTYAPNQNGQNFTTGGFTVGFDYRLNPSTAVGIAGSYFTGEVDFAGGNTDARGGAGSLYGTTEFGPLYLDGFVGGGFTDYDLRRTIGLPGVGLTATGSPGGSFVAAAANVGYRFESRGTQGLLRWGPVADIRFNNVSIDSYTETGAGALSTHVRGRDVTSVQSGLGAEWWYDMTVPNGIVTPHLRVTWQHEFSDITDTAIANFIGAPGAPFTLTSSRLGRDFASVTAGISGVVSPGIRLSADYTGEMGQTNQNVHQFSLTARIAF